MNKDKFEIEQKKPARVAIAVSGGGRSLLNFIRSESTFTTYKIAAVIASRNDCMAVTIAQEHNIPIFVGSFTKNECTQTREKLYHWINNLEIDWIVLAGFLRPFPINEGWTSRILNIHPALLPQFGGKGMYGRHVHEAVILSKAKKSGATVHFVTEKYDEGAIIAQVEVPIEENDNHITLAQKVFEAECHLYPLVLNKLINGVLPLPSGEIWRTKHGSF